MCACQRAWAISPLSLGPELLCAVAEIVVLNYAPATMPLTAGVRLEGPKVSRVGCSYSTRTRVPKAINLLTLLSEEKQK